jgi:hypothetical protein
VADNGSLAESIERSRDEGKRTELTQIIQKLKGLADS